MLRSVDPLWYTCFFSALAFGIGWYGLAWRLFARDKSPLGSSFDRLNKMQTYGGFCVGVCTYTITYRVLPFHPMTTNGVDLQSKKLAFFSNWSGVWYGAESILQTQAAISALAAGFLAVKTWGLLPTQSKIRLRFAILIALLAGVGMMVPVLGVLRIVPTPFEETVRKLDLDEPLNRGLFLDDPAYEVEADQALATYFMTHAADGTPLSLGQVMREQVPGWESLDDAELRHRRCELCRLPEAAIWTTQGLAFLLGTKSFQAESPSLIVEVPRHPETIRVYGLEAQAPVHIVSKEDLGAELAGTPWLVLKIDQLVSGKDVFSLLRTIRDSGVQRVDLAVIPYGFKTVSKRIPQLALDSVVGAAPFKARESWKNSNVVVISKYVPPYGQPIDPRPICTSRAGREFDEPWTRYETESPGALPELVRMTFKPDEDYRELIAKMQSIWTAGVSVVEVALNEDSENGD